MSLVQSLTRHFYYAFMVGALIGGLKAQDPAIPVSPAPVIAAAPDPSKSLNFRATGANLGAEPASLESTTAAAPVAATAATTSLVERRDALETEIRLSRSRLETSRRR